MADKVDVAGMAELIELAKFVALLQFKQSSKNPNASFVDYRDVMALKAMAATALARIGGAA